MSEPYVGEIRLFGFNFAPLGWAFCDGQALSIVQNSILYGLLGTTYGGDGQNTFNLPDLRGRIPVGTGGSFPLALMAGEENHTLSVNEMPAHSHAVQCGAAVDNSAAAASPKNNYWTRENNGDAPYTASASGLQPMAGNAISVAGGNQPHSNLQPYLTVNYCISLFGVFPTTN